MEYKYKPGQTVVVKNVKNASAVGYLGTSHTVCDYIKTPNLIKFSESGEPIYLCKSENGDYAWFYESEFESQVRVFNVYWYPKVPGDREKESTYILASNSRAAMCDPYFKNVQVVEAREVTGNEKEYALRGGWCVNIKED